MPGSKGDSEALFDHLQKAIGYCVNFLVGRAAQGALNDQEGQTMNGRPGEILRPRPPFPWKGTRLYHQVESCREQLKWIEAGLACLCGIDIALNAIRDGECCSEETRLRDRKLQVPCAYCAKGRPCRFRGKFASADAGDLCLNRPRAPVRCPLPGELSASPHDEMSCEPLGDFFLLSSCCLVDSVQFL